MGFANGYTLKYEWNLDGLGIFYISVIAVWTAALIPGIVLLIKNRNLPYIRMRNVPLVVSAVCVIHVYWILCLAAYVLNGFFPCSTEYWIMSIYLPLGIALYHASNTQLLHVAGLQKQYAENDRMDVYKEKAQTQNRGWRRPVSKFMSYGATKKTMSCIVVGMLVQVRIMGRSPMQRRLTALQVAIASVVFVIARQFHPGFGLYGQEVSMGDCRRGWEWCVPYFLHL